MKKITLLIFLLATVPFDNANAQWSNLQGGANDPVRDFYSDSTNQLYVVGRFTQIGSKNINQIAIWDGSDWSSFGSNDKFSSPGDVLYYSIPAARYLYLILNQSPTHASTDIRPLFIPQDPAGSCGNLSTV